jgi:hypothetical protein
LGPGVSVSSQLAIFCALTWSAPPEMKGRAGSPPKQTARAVGCSHACEFRGAPQDQGRLGRVVLVRGLCCARGGRQAGASNRQLDVCVAWIGDGTCPKAGRPLVRLTLTMGTEYRCGGKSPALTQVQDRLPVRRRLGTRTIGRERRGKLEPQGQEMELGSHQRGIG